METHEISIKGILLSKESQTPIAGLQIEIWDKNLVFDTPVGKCTSDLEGRFEVRFSEKRLLKLIFDRKPDLFFKVFYKGQLIKSTENDVIWNFDSSHKPIVVKLDWPHKGDPGSGDANDGAYKIKGKVVDSNGVALSKMTMEALIKTVDKDKVIAKTRSNKDGSYSMSFVGPVRVKSVDIQIKAYHINNKKKFTLSQIKYNASKNEELDVIVEAKKVHRPSEFEIIFNDVQSNLGKLKWSDLKESEEDQHITFLSNKTGWDGRMTAMLATSQQLGDQLKLNPAHIYALLRAGVSGTSGALLSLSVSSVENAIKTAIEKNIIQDTGNIQETLDTLGEQSINYLLTSKPFASVSSMSDMLDLRLNPEQKNVFAQTYKQVGNNSGKLWTALQQKGFSSEAISELQLDGKLGYLTGNNVPLMQNVYENFQITTDIELVGSGLYKASEWKDLIGDDAPSDLTTDDYATQLANMVKLSYPTAVVGEMINRNELPLGENTSQEELVGFFHTNQSEMIMGRHPVKTWIGFDNLSTTAKAAAKTIERIYQMSPSDESMVALLNNQIHSAYQISEYTKPEFLLTYGKSFPNLWEAEQTFDKGTEVYSAALGIATGYITNRSMPNVYAISGEIEKTQGETIAYPTLEELFGNIDYCSCEHCKSVLSPAAYFVELMQFIDLGNVPPLKSNPIDALLERRPDIQHIQLTCENTNKALPYIDLVNEILEHYILNGNLTDLKGHDITEETSQDELLAEPQFVEESVYNFLKEKVFPYNLPFHQPLETLRQLFQMWDLSLERALGFFSTPLSSRKEALGLNEDEYKTLTNIGYKSLPEYFGKPAGNTIAQLNAAIANGKTFSRTVGINYEDLVKLLKTNFINPGYAIVQLFQKLQISLEDLQGYYEDPSSYLQLEAQFPADIDPAEYGEGIEAWLVEHEDLIMGLITLTDLSSDPNECDFAEVELRYALPDNSTNSLSTTAYRKFHRFLRLLRKTGWSIETLDDLLKVMLPIPSDQITDLNIDATFITVLDRLANFIKLADYINFSEKKYPKLLLILDSSQALSLRQEQCARLLKLSITDLLELSAITGIDPLTNDLEDDGPSLLKLIMIARRIKEQSLKVVDLAYLLHHKDLNGKLTPTDETHLKNISILRSAINSVEVEQSIAPDNADFNFARSKMILVYNAATTDEFFEILLSTKIYSESFITDEESLPALLLKIDANLDFDPFKQKLTYIGVLSAQAKAAIEVAADGLVLADMEIITIQAQLDAFIADIKTALGLIATDCNTDLVAFENKYPELKIIYDDVKLEQTPSAQAQKLVNSVLPELKSKLKSNALKLSLTGILKSDADTVNVLTSKKEIIKSAAVASEPVLFDFIQLENKMVFDQNQTYHFYIEVPATDDYLLYVSAPENTVVSIKVDGQTIINNATIGPGEEVNNAVPLALKIGVIKMVEMTISSLPSGKQAHLLWRTKGIAKTTIPNSAMYEGDKVDIARTSLIRLSKASQLQNLFQFTAEELEYFASENSETSNFLNELATDGNISNVEMSLLWGKLELLVFFNSIKNENEPEENSWVQVLKNPSLANAQGLLFLESFNMWQEADLTELLTHMGLNRADLSKLSILRKVMIAMKLITEVGYPATKVVSWITNDPSYELVAGIKDTVKNNVTEAAWLETMHTVSDPVRNSLRDALVSYILKYQKPSAEVVNPDKLYEYFLVDVEMDACMKTSRIRLALSTLQLFIQRCLINLEPMVAPESIKADHWAWMKRYRVWEANRKVFLFPENWLEPELRDSKSSLFKELEGELLQAEVTDESAELAFLNYLKKLDDIAKLEMVGMYLEEDEKNNQDDDILHVIGRTNGNTRQYYYRRYEYGYWTPWEKVSLNIEGEHVFPIVWRKRLFVFWLNIIEKAAPINNNNLITTIGDNTWNANAKVNVEINICWGEYYKGKWSSPKSTDMNRPMIIRNLASFDRSNLNVYGRKEMVENPTDKFRERLIIHIRYYGVGNKGVFTFTSKNAPPYLEYKDDSILYNRVRDNLITSHYNPYDSSDKPDLFNTQLLMPGSNFKVNVKQPFGAYKPEVSEKVLTKKNMLTDGFSILPPWYPTENQYEAPLTYADEHSTFFVKPGEESFYAIWKHEEYYPIFEELVVAEFPDLIEEPVPDWPPKDIIDFGDDVVIDNPWEWTKEGVNVNTNYNKVLATPQTFAFDGTEFGAGGKMNIPQKNQF